ARLAAALVPCEFMDGLHVENGKYLVDRTDQPPGNEAEDRIERGADAVRHVLERLADSARDLLPGVYDAVLNRNGLVPDGLEATDEGVNRCLLDGGPRRAKDAPQGVPAPPEVGDDPLSRFAVPLEAANERIDHRLDDRIPGELDGPLHHAPDSEDDVPERLRALPRGDDGRR